MKYSIVIFFCIISLSSFAQTDDQKAQARKYSNEFLKIGVGARAFGMGNAMSGVADDVTAGYWNPAGLTDMDTITQGSLMHASYFANVASYDYAGLVLPIDSTHRFAVSLIRLGVNDIPNTLDLVSNGNIDYSKVKSFNTADFAAIFSYAWRLKRIRNLSFGTNVKIVYRGVGRFANAWGFGLDLAAKYRIKNLSLSANLLDATRTYNMWTFNTETFEKAYIATGNVIPQNSVELTNPALRLGLSYRLFANKKISALLAADTDWTFDGQRNVLVSSKSINLDPRLGVELAYRDGRDKMAAFLRGGVYNFQREKDADGVEKLTYFPTAGVGFVLRDIYNLQIDYALANIGNFSENLYSHVVSLKFDLSKRKSLINQ